MKKLKGFKDFIKKPNKLNVLSWPGHETLRDDKLSEHWNGKDLDNAHTGKKNVDGVNITYKKEFHDHPDIKPLKLTLNHKEAISDYTGSSYKDSETGHGASRNINGYLRNREGSRDEDAHIKSNHSESDVHAAVKKLSSAFTPENTNKKKVIVHGGIPKHIGDSLKSAGEGSQHHLAGFTSTSSSQSTAHNFSRMYNMPSKGKEHHVIEYHAEPGTALSVVKHSRMKENEVLLHHGAKITYHGTSIHDNADGSETHVHKVTVHNEHKPLEQYGKYQHPTK